MSAGVSRAIVELAAMGRISATSAMVVAPEWPRLARDLDAISGRIGIGLHLTFTGLSPLGPMPKLAPDRRFPPLETLIRSALTGRLPGDEVAAEIDCQIEAFQQATGRPPDFVDGHQHVHVLPGIRGPLLRALARRNLTGRLWLRDPFDRPGAILVRGVAVPKALLVAGLSAGFGAQARRAGFATNNGFSGFSLFDVGRDIGADFARFLAAPGPAHLVMCHPGHVARDEILDGVGEARRREFAYLASDEWAALLAEHGLYLARAPDTADLP